MGNCLTLPYWIPTSSFFLLTFLFNHHNKNTTNRLSQQNIDVCSLQTNCHSQSSKFPKKSHLSNYRA